MVLLFRSSLIRHFCTYQQNVRIYLGGQPPESSHSHHYPRCLLQFCAIRLLQKDWFIQQWTCGFSRNHRRLRQQPSQQKCRQRAIPETRSSASNHSSGATAVAITLHNLQITDYQSLAAKILIVSDKIHNGVSPATKAIMDDHAIDHPSFFHQPWAMMDFIFARHGTVISENIAEAKRTLRLPFDNVLHSLDSQRVAIQHQFKFLQRAHNPVNQGDMMDFYETSVAAHPHILSAIRLYKNATLFADRSFVTMAAYTEIRAPDQVANSIDFGYTN